VEPPVADAPPEPETPPVPVLPPRPTPPVPAGRSRPASRAMLPPVALPPEPTWPPEPTVPPEVADPPDPTTPPELVAPPLLLRPPDPNIPPVALAPPEPVPPLPTVPPEPTPPVPELPPLPGMGWSEPVPEQAPTIASAPMQVQRKRPEIMCPPCFVTLEVWLSAGARPLLRTKIPVPATQPHEVRPQVAEGGSDQPNAGKTSEQLHHYPNARSLLRSFRGSKSMIRQALRWITLPTREMGHRGVSEGEARWLCPAGVRNASVEQLIRLNKREV
jgi:hypothetical protein